jgi:transcription-repair coupling factor (superfamily II helicase)
MDFLGYSSSPLVEDVGQYAFRGGILDVFSPAHEFPVRMELFGDTIETLKFFDPASGRSLEETKEFHLIPTAENLFTDENRQSIVQSLLKDAEGRPVEEEELNQIQRDIVLKHHFPGSEFLLP